MLPAQLCDHINCPLQSPGIEFRKFLQVLYTAFYQNAWYWSTREYHRVPLCTTVSKRSWSSFVAFVSFQTFCSIITSIIYAAALLRIQFSCPRVLFRYQFRSLFLCSISTREQQPDHRHTPYEYLRGMELLASTGHQCSSTTVAAVDC